MDEASAGPTPQIARRPEHRHWTWIGYGAVAVAAGGLISMISPLIPSPEAFALLLVGMVSAAAFVAIPLRSALPWLIAAMAIQGFLVLDVGILWLPAYTFVTILLVRAWLAGRFPIPHVPVTRPVKVLLMLTAASTVVAVYLRPTFGSVGVEESLRFGLGRPFIQLAAMLLVAAGYFVAVACAKDRVTFRRSVTVFVHVGTIVALFAIYEQLAYYLDLPSASDLPGRRRDVTASFALDGRTIFRSSSTFLEPGHLGRFVVTTLLVSVSLLLSPRGVRKRRGLGIAIGIQLIGLVSTFSTAAFLALGTGMLSILLVTRWRSRFLLSSLVGALVLFGAGTLLATRLDVAASSIHLFGQRSQQTLSAELDALQASPQGSRRVDYWRASVNMAVRYPLTGVGLGNFGIAASNLDRRLLPNAGSYGLLWGWLGEFGIPGLLLYGWLIVSFIAGMLAAHRVANRSHPEVVGFLAALVAMMTHYLSSGYIRMEVDSWILMGLAMAAFHHAGRPHHARAL